MDKKDSRNNKKTGNGKKEMQDKLFSNTFPNDFKNASAVSQTYGYDSLEDFDELEKEDDYGD